jgi:tetratricopeptide (TPR) repeat protein
MIALVQKDGLTAINAFRVISQDRPQDPESLLFLARAHLINNEIELAKQTVKKALALKPDYLEARQFYYDFFLTNKDYDGAVQAAQEAVRLNEKDLLSLSYLGDFYVLKGDEGQARKTFQRMIEIQPDSPQGYLKLALLSRKQKNAAEAIKFLETTLQKQPDYLPAAQLLVGIYQEQKQPEKALQTIRQTLARSPKNPQLHQMLGELLLAQKNVEPAVAAFEESLVLNPGNSQAARLLMLAFRLHPDRTKVMTQLEDKIASGKNPIFYSLVQAMLLEQDKDYDKTIQMYGEILPRASYPMLLIVRNNLAYLLAEHRPTPENLERAIKLATENLEDNPEDPRLQDTLGWIYCKQGNYAKGKVHLEKGVAAAPNQPTLLYHLSWCAAKLGETGPAKEMLEKALAEKTVFEERGAAEELLKSLTGAGKP